MGEGILKIWKNNIQKNWKIAFVATFIIGMIVHIYKFTNTLLGHDSIYNFYSDQNIVGSGRWFLSIACGISSYFDLPWINGLLSIIYISLTSVVIVEIFQIKNPIAIIISGGLLATFPGITETFFFGFTADGYMLAMLLAALSVYFSKIQEKRIYMLILSGVCICLSCGIYQAYVSFALILALCYFIYEMMENKYSNKEYFKWIRNQVIIYISALAAYYIIWKLCLLVQGTTANSYQGISEVGKIDISVILQGIPNTITSLAIFFLEWNILEHPITLYGILNIVFIIFFIIGLIIAFVKSQLIKRKLHLALAIICLILCIPISCIWHFTSSGVIYRPMMLVSICVIYIFSVFLFNRWVNIKLSNIACVLFATIIFNFSLMANISYYYLDKENERTFSMGTEMIIKIHEYESKYEINNIAIIGERGEKVWVRNESEFSDKAHLLTHLMETDLLFNQEHTVNYLKNIHGLDLEAVSDKELETLTNSDEVQGMDIWPSQDSLKVIDDTLIIKISD